MKRRSVRTRWVDSPAGPYVLLTVFSCQPDWDKVASKAEAACHSKATAYTGSRRRLPGGKRELVLPLGLTPPQNGPLCRFSPEALALTVLRNTAVSVVHTCRVPLYRKAVTLVDPSARCTSFVRELLCHCITVKVITKERERYEAVSDEMMEELGAGIVCADSPGLCEGSMLVIAPWPEDAAQLCTRAPVLTAGVAAPYPGCHLVGEPELRPGAEWGAVPRGVAALDFFGAFYEQGRWPQGETAYAAGMRCGGKLLTVRDIACYIEQNQGVWG